jgi:hypothetical protein
MIIENQVTTAGNGLFASQTLQAEFLRGAPAYQPSTDPRLPMHDLLAANFTSNSTTITVSNVSLYPSPNLAASSYGSIRLLFEVMLYSNVWVGNSTIGGFTRNVASTGNCVSSGSVIAGNLISILGLRTVSS